MKKTEDLDEILFSLAAELGILTTPDNIDKEGGKIGAPTAPLARDNRNKLKTYAQLT